MSNRLADETSPYLLQHANNPVDWHPWGAEALQLARQLDRPIFLSIGYSACHWCHVMEHESFENSDIAALMNQWYVCIKVDREERPDLDQIYMSAVTAMTGSGGWPMSVFLTPDLKPFYGGTYWPPTARWNRPGFREILAGVHDAWTNRRDAVNSQADELTDHVVSVATPTVPPSPLNANILQNGLRSLLRAADRVHGGFGSPPKFPHPMDLRVALRCWKRFGSGSSSFHSERGRSDGSASQPVSRQLSAESRTAESRAAEQPNAEQLKADQPKAESRPSLSTSQPTDDALEILEIVVLTLDKMARGGIYDHLGGGFARYSTDERWLAPHFEKMLYDNALLVPVYLEAWQITGRPDFERVARETLDYVLREMTQPAGAFYATQDADSEGVEGKFFVWSEAEVEAVLGADDARTFAYCYDVTTSGNWEHTNILNRPKTHQQAAAILKVDANELDATLARCRQKLLDVRSKRVWPGRDDKVLAGWNGLMIAAMSMGANVLGEPKYASAARAAADFILREMRTDDGRLLHCCKDGRARFNAYLDDYAGLIDGLCELYQAVFDARYLEAALGLAERMLGQFWDDRDGGFFYTSADHETLIARNKETHDNATPSGNSLAATALLKLARLTGRTDLESRAVATLEMMSGQMERIPMACGQALIALDFLLGPTHELTVVGHPADGEQLLNRLSRQFLPNKVIHVRSADSSDASLAAPVRASLAGKSSRDGQPTLYVCQNGSCAAPVVGLAEIERVIQGL